MGGWTHSICFDCYHKEHGLDKEPCRVRDHEPVKCCFCGRWTIEGIFVRRDPDKMKCKCWVGKED